MRREVVYANDLMENKNDCKDTRVPLGFLGKFSRIIIYYDNGQIACGVPKDKVSRL